MISKRPLSNSDYTFDEASNTLIAEGLKIKSIDSMPKNISKNTNAINLANNYLTTLQGVEQFVNLEEICLKNNRIQKGTNLLTLANLKKLNKMEIEGNPFLK